MGSISVVLTQLEKTVALFEAVNADTPLTKEPEEIDQKITRLETSPRRRLSTSDSGRKLTVSKKRAVLHLKYVDKEWWGTRLCTLGLEPAEKEKAAQKQETMNINKWWLTLPDPTKKKHRKAREGAKKLTKHW